MNKVGEYSAKVMGKKVETLVIEMKKLTYIKQNEHLLEDSSSDSESEEDVEHMSIDSKVSKIASKLSL
jgi:hypothetical protein